jgi:hypothetical protein
VNICLVPQGAESANFSVETVKSVCFKTISTIIIVKKNECLAKNLYLAGGWPAGAANAPFILDRNQQVVYT